MTEAPNDGSVVFHTKWFDIVARSVPGSNGPHYVINCTDFVTVVAVTTEGKLLLVRQFRPALGAESLELPSGHVEIGETPEQAARKELLEETGHVVDQFELISEVSPAIGRFSNRMWCYFAGGARPTNDPGYRLEDGVDPIQFAGSVRDLVGQKEFCSSLSHTALFAAIVRGRMKLD